MNEIKFNSQICTTKEQSQRLLDLGLKPETADCMYSVMTKSYNGRYILEEDRQYNLILFRQEEVQSVGFSHYEHIPAWSLHRLLSIGVNGDYMGLWNININRDTVEALFEQLIRLIEWAIEDGAFNKEYLSNERIY